jgi:hypothetical protein
MRIVIVGGPLHGKSTLAASLGLPVYCGDPRSTVREPRAGVTYLPEGLPMAGDDGPAQWIVDHWLTRPGPWVVEGWIMARTLRRWVQTRREKPCDRVIVLTTPKVPQTPRQLSITRGVATVWQQVAFPLKAITEYR